ncbi:MAG: hypothetical protein A2284_01730 [Deltaproteobacteria bacterium RIFOXYA12_FULL_61_11]|nr:MAG: hypothetical protein A2284_01730 [Deltaproteobacteria bacterium RIFOXYA12_FULL_61_11]
MSDSPSALLPLWLAGEAAFFLILLGLLVLVLRRIPGPGAIQPSDGLDEVRRLHLLLEVLEQRQLFLRRRLDVLGLRQQEWQVHRDELVAKRSSIVRKGGNADFDHQFAACVAELEQCQREFEVLEHRFEGYERRRLALEGRLEVVLAETVPEADPSTPPPPTDAH